MKIDITTTATLRPELYEQSLKSIVKHLHGDFRLLINIDPVGPGTVEEVVAVAKAYFPEALTYSPKIPNFQKAQLLLWSSVWSKYFFNFEDDWELTADIDVAKMVEVMDRHEDLALLRLPKWESRKVTRQWNKWEIPWNGEFFEIPKNMRGALGFSGHPSLIRHSFLKPTLNVLDIHRDVEKQLKGRGAHGHYILSYRYGVWQEQDASASIVDIGTPWRKTHKWGKDGPSKFLWTTWKKLEE